MGTAAASSPLYFMSFNIAAALICISCIVYMALRRRFDKLQSKVFLLLVVDLLVTASSDAAAELIRTYVTDGALALSYVQAAGYIYFVMHSAFAPLFYLYVRVVCREPSNTAQLRSSLIALPFLVTELIAITNPITNWMYSYGEDAMNTRNWAMYLAYAVGVFYFALSIVQLLRRWRALNQVKRRALTYFFVMALAGVLLQLFVPVIRIELFAESLAVLGVLMFVENEDDLIDSELGVYNRYALEMDLGAYDNTRLAFNAIAVRVENVDAYAHIGGSTLAVRSITSTLADYFKTIMPWYYVYRAAPTRFVLMDPQSGYEDTLRMANEIAARFKRSWSYLDFDIDLGASVALVRVPEDLPSPRDVLYLVDTPVPSVSRKDVLAGDDLNYLMRRAEVERAVQRGLDEGCYEVYYQPIYGKDGEVHAAEALMRLHDRVLGSVPPFEFIEVAERMGLVEAIGEFALREVCAFLASGVPQSFGVRHISVNLSVAQCMQADFAREADAVVSSYDIDPNLVSYEITESIAAGDYEFLGKVVNQLKGSGHRFAMDDYGTGYSNMHSLVALDFDVVKIDKSVLWDAEESDMGMVILENGVSMMRDIGCEVLVEGVETEYHVNLLRTLGVDYYQGFYYAKPMPKDEFVAFLGKTR